MGGLMAQLVAEGASMAGAPSLKHHESIMATPVSVM